MRQLLMRENDLIARILRETNMVRLSDMIAELDDLLRMERIMIQPAGRTEVLATDD